MQARPRSQRRTQGEAAAEGCRSVVAIAKTGRAADAAEGSFLRLSQHSAFLRAAHGLAPAHRQGAAAVASGAANAAAALLTGSGRVECIMAQRGYGQGSVLQLAGAVLGRLLVVGRRLLAPFFVVFATVA